MCEDRDSQQVIVKIATHLSHTGHAEFKLIAVDACIAPIVRALQIAGIDMLASCCGHGKAVGRIDLADGRVLLVESAQSKNAWATTPEEHQAESAQNSSLPLTLGEAGARDTAPLPDLHQRIMNIPPMRSYLDVPGEEDMRHAYLLGHRDARHAAAELALAPPPETLDDDLHTGDDALLDALTAARVALEEWCDDPDDMDAVPAISTAREALTKADTLRVAELRLEAGSPALPPAPSLLSALKLAHETLNKKNIGGELCAGHHDTRHPGWVAWMERRAKALFAIEATLCEVNQKNETGRESSIAEPTPQARCLDCGKDYADFPMDVILPRPQWLEIHPNENGLLCAACIVARCAKVPRATCCHLIIEIAPPRLAAEAPVLPPIEQRLHDTEAQLTAVRGESQRRAEQLDAALERERNR